GTAHMGPAALSLSMVGGEKKAFADRLEEKGLDARGGNRGALRTGFVAGAPVKDVKAAFGYGHAPNLLLDRVSGSERGPSWLGTDQRLGDDLIVSGGAAAVAHRAGDWTLGFAAGAGRTLDRDAEELRIAEDGRAARLSVRAARDIGPAQLALGYERLDESDSFLGSRGSAVLGLSGASTDFATAQLSVALGSGWTLGLDARAGLTRLDLGVGGLAESAERLKSSAFAFDLTRRGAFMAGDMLGLRISQPLRIEAGAITLGLPTDYDYAVRAPIYTLTDASLTPSGREIAVETAYERPLAQGYLQANAYWRRQPGHVAPAADDAGVALRLGARF
ncbi:MAG: hypothetical protein WA979_09820, partial [Pacificimonas sp.]